MNTSINPYVPILAIGAIGFGFALISIVAAALTGPKRYNRAKSDAYECGIEPSPQAAGGGRFPVKYFLDALATIIKKISPIIRERIYPLILFASTPPTAAGVAANEVSKINVVETGILKRVRISKNIGAAICKK